MFRRILVIATIFGGLTVCAPAAEVFKEVLGSANALLGSLSDEQRDLALLPFNSDERLNWHYVPKERLGIPLQKLDEKQRELALALLKALLSQSGFETVETIRSLEDVLKVIEGGKGPVRDPEMYYFIVFGTPSETENWGVRYEGHHISLHWTIVDGKIVSSFPQFLGSNPGEVKDGPRKGTRPLGATEDIGRKLVKSLDEKQRADGILQRDVPADVITGNAREAAIEENVGVSYTALNADQQGVLISLIQLLANIQRPELAEDRLSKLREAGIENIKFAWIGGLEKGEKHYYRVQGSTFVIEYDNTQNDANHIHVVWRDFEGDFGQDILKGHYTAHANNTHPGDHIH
ncbi:MAG: DUF3500 domain-containing protein [Candidatus Hydrogenedentes bacterium]|nr:DUF3500 domain-containing protein [Candidatus Hydrogenedentota bacterium]